MAEKKNLWLPSEHVASAVLGGVTGKVEPGSRFIRHNYGGKSETESTALQITVTAEGLDRPRVLLVGCGNLWPSEEMGGAKTTEGKFFTGGAPNKQSNIHDFLVNLEASGFPFARFAEMGSEALDGAVITFKALEKTVGGGKGKAGTVKVYEVPGKFVGFDGEVEAAEPEEDGLGAEVAGLLLQALEAKGEIPRGQLGIAVGPLLGKHPQKAKALGLLLKDDFLATVEGISFDKKIVRKAA